MRNFLPADKIEKQIKCFDKIIPVIHSKFYCIYTRKLLFMEIL